LTVIANIIVKVLISYNVINPELKSRTFLKIRTVFSIRDL